MMITPVRFPGDIPVVRFQNPRVNSCASKAAKSRISPIPQLESGDKIIMPPSALDRL
ncbi:hypothetical protein L195_g038862, partial [Trifolium pratense]